ncbi:TPA: YkgJ family cysteine cluster protein [Vibrio parahaemolyticus]|nr:MULTISPECIES: YkgJ family cysteine cluster protein [Vibrio]EIK0773677.1 YkgJ family cysteine cluster protein [Vibrio alginolyticus]EJX1709463.1 YkgJ family cysteine cluster protein [Vibrio cholerae]EGQ7688514.1 YkgJ family cysteine cluster protein [Vibrio parahaemolyticus]EGQ8186813.1 YkgJ family cysteine cluster protein [Vibrio parahaemolyticus]EGQ8546647.1 YkgJ family cysteine cluster protein [Vibrio parahaemolyticus]
MRNLAADTKVAQKNISKIQTLIPRKLLVKEDKIAKKQAKSSDSDINKLQQLFKLTEELTNKLSPVTSCKAGCGNCCKINVSITKLEAELISEYTGRALNNLVAVGKPDYHGSSCTFLIDNKCSVYSVRPFVCRRQVSVMPSEHWCHPDLNLDVEVPMIEFSELSNAFYAIAARSEVKDIRAWFG